MVAHSGSLVADSGSLVADSGFLVADSASLVADSGLLVADSRAWWLKPGFSLLQAQPSIVDSIFFSIIPMQPLI